MRVVTLFYLMVKIGEIKSCSEIDWERERVVWWRGTKTKLDDGSVLYFVLVVRSSRSVYQSISVEVGPGKKRKKDERRRDERKGKIDGVECALRRVFAVREENWSPDKSRNGEKAKRTSVVVLDFPPFWSTYLRSRSRREALRLKGGHYR